MSWIPTQLPNASFGARLLWTVGLVAALVVAAQLLRTAVGAALGRRDQIRARFWTQQAVRVAMLAGIIAIVVAVWLSDATRFAGAVGIVTAGVAVALQRVITAFAAYLIILRGRIFTVGDRITIGGVRGDVVALGFMQTTVMEMGQPPGDGGDEPGTWVHARQFTGRIVRVSNDKIFDAPVYNFTREFPFLWEEIHLPVKYDADRARAEQILLDAARRHTTEIVARARPALAELQKTFPLRVPPELEPRVFWRLTDNWLELSLRFLADDHGVRPLKDAMSRDILAALDEDRIGIASATYEIVGVPPV
ncbi:MAG TPA: mechanosensitive ion channel domain-containing protein, partial [Gemmatimonadaceae bacterium]|nr:mechanosensitive ion channel domain-containing protein [Gemmatimonadaceae bacterium]